MTTICLKPLLALRRLAYVCVGTALVSLSTGCTSTGTSATVAPRSNVTRENAMALAQLTAATVGGQVFTVAPTGSMKPTLDESSVVTVEKVGFGQLRQGDIVIYRSVSGAPIVHRLFEQQGQRWLVLGDNNGTIDREAVTEGNLIGRVCAIFYTASGGTSSAPTAMAAR
jgi:signal peptidase I